MIPAEDPVFLYRIHAPLIVNGIAFLPGDAVAISPLSTVVPFAVLRLIKGEWEVVHVAPRWIDGFQGPILRGDVSALSVEALAYLRLTSAPGPSQRLA